MKTIVTIERGTVDNSGKFTAKMDYSDMNKNYPDAFQKSGLSLLNVLIGRDVSTTTDSEIASWNKMTTSAKLEERKVMSFRITWLDENSKTCQVTATFNDGDMKILARLAIGKIVNSLSFPTITVTYPNNDAPSKGKRGVSVLEFS